MQSHFKINIKKKEQVSEQEPPFFFFTQKSCRDTNAECRPIKCRSLIMPGEQKVGRNADDVAIGVMDLPDASDRQKHNYDDDDDDECVTYSCGFAAAATRNRRP